MAPPSALKSYKNPVTLFPFNAVPETHICSGCCGVPRRRDEGTCPTAAGCADNSQPSALSGNCPHLERATSLKVTPPFLVARSHTTEPDVEASLLTQGYTESHPSFSVLPTPTPGISCGFAETASQPSFSFHQPASFPFPLLPCHGCWPQGALNNTLISPRSHSLRVSFPGNPVCNTIPYVSTFFHLHWLF